MHNGCSSRRFLVAAVLLLLVAPLSLRALAQIPEDSPVRGAMERAEAAVDSIVNVPDGQRTFTNTIEAIDDLVAQLDVDTSMMQLMAYVSTDADERQRGLQAEEHVTNWMIGLLKREDLYKAVRAFADTDPDLQTDQQQLLDDLLRDFRRAGMALPPEQRQRLKDIQMQVNKLGIEFEKNIRDDETRVPLTREELAGMSDEFCEGLPRTNGLYLTGMDYPTFVPILDLCDNETTRHKVWVAFKRRGGKKNVALLEDIIRLRAQAAQILGYKHPADYEIEVRMAKTAANVQAFYDKLRPLVRTKARKDYEEFTQAKREHTGDPDARLHPWDYSFYKKYLMKTRYAVDSEQVRQYFPLQRVIDGLFTITQSLYGLEYRDVTDRSAAAGKLWHPDVKHYEVYDKASGQMLGEFYLDLYPRENKYTHAAQWGLWQHKIWADGREQTPVAALVCNFPKPTQEKPSLLPHEDVETLFHEFGHCLHTILSDVRYSSLAGTSVARDFVEAPSQMFENWVWDADVLGLFARHYQTGEPIPDELVQGMIRARNLGSGLFWEHQFFYGLVDLAYHTVPDGHVDTTQVGLDVFDDVELYEPQPETYFQAAFGHLVGYQAGYYGYVWSRVFAQDMFQRFKELGMLDSDAGMYYRKKILARGGVMDEMDMIRDYLGREPNMDAFLEHIGLDPGALDGETIGAATGASGEGP
jgi:thimet oligopeptidase